MVQETPSKHEVIKIACDRPVYCFYLNEKIIIIKYNMNTTSKYDFTFPLTCFPNIFSMNGSVFSEKCESL